MLAQDLADSKFPNVILVCTTTATETMDQAVRAKFEEEIYIGCVWDTSD